MTDDKTSKPGPEAEPNQSDSPDIEGRIGPDGIPMGNQGGFEDREPQEKKQDPTPD